MNAATAAQRRALISRGNALDELAATANRGWYRARAYARPLVRWRVPVAKISGTTRATGTRQTIVVAGWKRTVAYYAERLFETMDPAVPIAHPPLLRLAHVLRDAREGCDLVMARVPHPASRYLFDDFYLPVPEAVDSRLAIPEDSADLARASTRARRNIARIRASGLSWTVSTDESDFQSFYDDFYVPFLRVRYRDLAHEIERAPLLRAFRRGCLLWVLQGERRLAGALFQPRGPVLTWVVMGVPGDGEEAARTGALSAIYLFGAECAARHGYRWLDLGFSKASPRDGVLSHKSSWGARVFCPWKVDHDLLFGWRAMTDEVARFLDETPLIVRNGDRLAAITALSPERAGTGSDAIAAGRKIAHAGLDDVFVCGTSPDRTRSATEPDGTRIHAVERLSSAEIRRRLGPSGRAS